MKLLKTIKFTNLDSKILENFQLRKAARAVAFDSDNKVGLLEVSKFNYHKLPGGGLKKGEDILKALKRECLEEIGCEIEITGELGLIIEYRDKIKIKQESYCYLAKIIGNKGRPDFTQKEISDGFKLDWVSLEEAISLLEKDKPSDYYGNFINKRDLIYLREVKRP